MNNQSRKWSDYREAVALFASTQALVAAIDLLRSHGVDRSRLSILGAGTDEEAALFEGEGFGNLRNVLDRADALDSLFPEAWDAVAPHSAPISGSVYVGTAPGATAATPVLGPLVAATIASAGKLPAAVGKFLLHRLGGQQPAPFVTAALAEGGVVLWVLLSDDDEREVAHLLRKAGGREIRLQHVPSAAEISAAQA